jgi:DNA-binding transcriptional LysR family regulator
MTTPATSDLDAAEEPAEQPRARDLGPDAPPLNLHLQQLAYVRALERSGTLTEAARRLQVSQPALSQSLSQLERRLGVPLLERDGRRRQLTEAGREVARFAGETLARAGALRDWLDAYAEGREGTLRVGMIDAASLYALPSAIRGFRESHPEVQLELVVDRSGLLLERLARFELDLAFVVGPVAPEFDAVEVLHEPLYLYAPPGTTEEPSDGEWVLYPPGRQTRRIIDAGLVARGIWPRISLESDNPAVLGQMVALGLGWSVLPEGVVEGVSPELAASRRDQVAERTLLAARRAQSPPDARAEAFLRLVTEREGAS